MTETQFTLALCAIAFTVVLGLCVTIIHRASLSEVHRQSRNRRDVR